MKHILVLTLLLIGGYSHADKISYYGCCYDSRSNSAVISNSVVENSRGIASSIALGQHSYYWGASTLQMFAGFGYDDRSDSKAFAIGAAQVYKDVIINIGAAIEQNYEYTATTRPNEFVRSENSDWSIGAGVTWLVK